MSSPPIVTGAAQIVAAVPTSLATNHPPVPVTNNGPVATVGGHHSRRRVENKLIYQVACQNISANTPVSTPPFDIEAYNEITLFFGIIAPTGTPAGFSGMFTYFSGMFNGTTGLIQHPDDAAQVIVTPAAGFAGIFAQKLFTRGFGELGIVTFQMSTPWTGGTLSIGLKGKR